MEVKDDNRRAELFEAISVEGGGWGTVEVVSSQPRKFATPGLPQETLTHAPPS